MGMLVTGVQVTNPTVLRQGTHDGSIGNDIVEFPTSDLDDFRNRFLTLF